MKHDRVEGTLKATTAGSELRVSDRMLRTAKRQQACVNHRRHVDTRRLEAAAQKGEQMQVACEGCRADIYVVTVRGYRGAGALHRTLMRQALDAHMRATGCSGRKVDVDGVHVLEGEDGPEGAGRADADEPGVP